MRRRPITVELSPATLLAERYRAVREDTIAAQAIGIDVLPTRLSAFVIGAFFAGAGGSLYVHYLGSFSPAGFYFAYTFSLISMLVYIIRSPGRCFQSG